jgi:hypothetical protein
LVEMREYLKDVLVAMLADK